MIDRIDVLLFGACLMVTECDLETSEIANTLLKFFEIFKNQWNFSLIISSLSMLKRVT